MAVIGTSPLFSHRNGLTRVHPMILHRKRSLEHCGLQKWGIEYSWILHFEMCHYGKWSLSQLPVQDAGPRVPELLWGISLGNSTTICSTGKTGKNGVNGEVPMVPISWLHPIWETVWHVAIHFKMLVLRKRKWPGWCRKSDISPPLSKTIPKRWKVKSY